MKTARLLRTGIALLIGTSLILGCQAPAAPAPTTAPPATAVNQSAATAAPASAAKPAASQAAAPAAGKPAETAAAPKRGGTLVFALGQDPSSLNPAIATGIHELTAACITYQALVYTDKSYNPQPMLAQSWEVSPDNLVYIFALRQGVKWHDGQPFTSADVKFTYEEMLAKYHPRSKQLFADFVKSVETPTASTLKITLKSVYGPFLSQLTCFNAPVLPKHLFEGSDVLKNPHNTKDIVGTGPFKFENWVPGDRISYVRNDSYWQPGEPFLDRVIFKVIADPAARTAAIQAGEIDYVHSLYLPVQDYLRLKDDKRFQVGLGNNFPVDQMLTLNTQNAPLNDKRVRQALLTALDRELIDRQVYFNFGHLAKSMVAEEIAWAYNPAIDLTKQYAFNVQKANQLLDAAGFARGADGNRFKRLRFVYEVGRTGHPEMAQIAQQNWAAIGVPVEIVPQERSLMIDTVYVKRQFDITINELTTQGDPALGYARLYTCDSVRPVQFTNGAGFCNPDVDKLFAQGAGQAVNDKRAPAYFELQKMLADELPVIPLRQVGAADLVSAKFEFAEFWKSAIVSDLWGKIYQK